MAVADEEEEEEEEEEGFSILVLVAIVSFILFWSILAVCICLI